MKRHAKADTKTGVDLCQATPPAAEVNQQLLEALKQILGWRELRDGHEVPIERIENIARAAILAAPPAAQSQEQQQ